MMHWPQLFRTGVRASWANLSVELTPAVVLASRIPRTVLQALFFILLAYAAGGSELGPRRRVAWPPRMWHPQAAW